MNARLSWGEYALVVAAGVLAISAVLALAMAAAMFFQEVGAWR